MRMEEKSDVVRTFRSAKIGRPKGLRYAVGIWIAIAACLLAGGVASAQEGHPLTGTWVGDLSQRHVTVVLEWDGKNVAGTINPGPNASQIKAVRLDPAMWSIHIEADGKTHIVVDGGLANIGSASRTLTGTWTEGGTKTPITLTRVDSQSASSNSGELPASPAYDSTRRMTLRGTVTSLEWINPRVRFVVLVRDARGAASWTIELPDAATTL